MAMSFARPDPSSPASIADAAFGTGRRGFDQGEVRDFLRMVAAELGRLQERERFLERELRTAQASPDLASVELDDQALTRLLGEETARVLTTAREAAVEIRQKAEGSAAQLLTEASDEATRMREEAETEASRRRTDAAADAEAELAMAKQQGREMVNEARAYRERVLSELARRRELAREQIEQLLHGRDRLMQSFERARLVAVDVVAELQPLAEPDEYVNLAPTTGPVPVMVPNSPRPAGEGQQSSEADVTVPDISAEDTVVDDRALDAEEHADVSGTDAGTDTDAVESPADAGTDAEVDAEVDVETDTDADAEVDVETDTDIDAEVAVEAGTDVTGEARAEEPDDVVVDLFARLRADATLADHESAADNESSAEFVEAVDAAADHDSVEPEGVEAAGLDADEAPVEVTPFDQRDADLTPLIVASAKKLKRILADEQNEVLDALRSREPLRELDDVLPERAEHLGRYSDVIVDDLLAAASAGASLVTSGKAARLKKADAAKATAAAEAVLDEWLLVPLRERLERCVIDGGGDNAEVAKRVRSVYREWKTQHIDEQLDDVIRTAHGRGVFAAIESGRSVEWVADPAHDVCADCDDNTLGGAVEAGTAFPTGHQFPPAHLGCRCLLLPADR